VLILSFDPIHFHKVCQNLLVNFGSRSETMSFGRPWCLKTCVKNNLPISWVVASSFVGMKCAILLNRSTTTMMASNALDGGKLAMKSMDTLSHDPLGISKGCNKLVYFLLRVQFYIPHTHIPTYHHILHSILSLLFRRFFYCPNFCVCQYFAQK